MKLEKLLVAAWSARKNAHAPYSHFPVGAALETIDGQVFSGCNVENASFPCCTCAEQTAIAKAVSEGALVSGGLRRLVVATETTKPTPPCGSCRQIIAEFAGIEATIYLSCKPGEIALEMTVAELLPYSFNRENLIS